MTRLVCCLLPVLLVAACTGDDETLTADAAPGADATPQPDGGPPGCSCFVVGADVQNGVGTGAVVHLPSLMVEKNLAAGGVSWDPVVREQGGKVYVINRLGHDNIVVLDPADGFTVVDQFSTGPGSNPQDVAVVGGELWVVALGDNQVQIYDLADTTQAPTTIDLPTIVADADGNPDAASIAVLDAKAYVTLQHLESFTPAAPGSVVVIDTASKTVGQTITLPQNNPTNFMKVDGDRLLVGLTPDFVDVSNGCLAQVTPAPAMGSCLVENAELGGLVTGFAVADDGSTDLYVASGNFTSGTLRKVSMDGVPATPLSSGGQTPGDVAACRGWVVATDTAAGGIRVWDAAAKTELTTTALDIGLPPAFANAIACVRD